MEVLSVPRIIVAGVSAGVGKSLLNIGLAMALRKRNISVSCCVMGLNLIQSIILKRICGRYVTSLDERILSRNQILQSVFLSSVGADIIIIEGYRGLFDGIPSGGYYRGSDSELAILTRTPVCLVFDARGFETSIAALVKGYSSLVRGVDIAAVIANRIPLSGAALENRVKLFQDTLSEARLPPLLGGVPEVEYGCEFITDEITQARNQTLLPRRFLVDVGNLVEQHVDIDKITKVAARASPIRLEEVSNSPSPRRCRIAVTDDSAFNLCFQDNLQYLRYFGAELVPFSPLADVSLPKRIGGLYLTGGYLSEYGSELSKNTSIMNSIREFTEAGGVVYAEGAGTAYLCDSFKISESEEAFDGVGIIPATAKPGDGVLHYCESVTVEESILGRQGLIYKGITTGDWELSSADSIMKVARTSRSGMESVMDGYSPGAQIVASFSFSNWSSNPKIAKSIVDAATVASR